MKLSTSSHANFRDHVVDSRLLALVAIFTLSSVSQATAATITQWNFNVNAPGTNNSPVPSTGVGTANPVGMTSNANNADFPTAANGIGSSDPTVAGDLSWRVRGSVSNGWSGTTELLSGARFNVSTVGYTGITLTMDINATDGSPRHAQLQYTTDGSTFTSFGPLFDFNATNDNWANGLLRDLTAVPGVANNPNFGFKIVSAFAPFDFTDLGGFHLANTAFQRADADPLEGPYNGTAGNYRFDMVTVSGVLVPEPSTIVMMGIALASTVAIAARRRFTALG